MRLANVPLWGDCSIGFCPKHIHWVICNMIFYRNGETMAHFVPSPLFLSVKAKCNANLNHHQQQQKKIWKKTPTILYKLIRLWPLVRWNCVLYFYYNSNGCHCKMTHPSSSIRIMHKHHGYYCYFYLSVHILLLFVVAQQSFCDSFPLFFTILLIRSISFALCHANKQTNTHTPDHTICDAISTTEWEFKNTWIRIWHSLVRWAQYNVV